MTRFNGTMFVCNLIVTVGWLAVIAGVFVGFAGAGPFAVPFGISGALSGLLLVLAGLAVRVLVQHADAHMGAIEKAATQA